MTRELNGEFCQTGSKIGEPKPPESRAKFKGLRFNEFYSCLVSYNKRGPSPGEAEEYGQGRKGGPFKASVNPRIIEQIMGS